MKAFRKNQDGITLIEVLLTIGLIGLIGAALVRLGSTALTASDAGRQRAVATQLADEGLEAARAKRDQASSSFFADTFIGASGDPQCHTLPLALDGSSGSSCSSAPSSPDTGNWGVTGHDGYYRVVRFVRQTANKAEVTTYVFWNQDGTWSKVVSSTVLTQWR